MLPGSLRQCCCNVAIPALFIRFQRFLFQLGAGRPARVVIGGAGTQHPFSLHSAFISISRFLHHGAGSPFTDTNCFKRPQLTAKIAATSAKKLGSSRSRAVPS
jgi:hypothetical protein